MNIENFLSQFLNMTSTFNPKIGIFLFLICLIGEIKIPIPYLLETTWLLVGYQFGRGLVSPFHLILIWLTAQIGRQIGATILYYFSRLGSVPIVNFYNKNLKEKSFTKKFVPKLINKTNLTPFSVALGRLIALRIPLTLALAIKRKLKVLLLGVLLSSIVWDGMYIFLGAISKAVVLSPFQMLLFSLSGLTALYVIIFVIHYFVKFSKG